MPVSDEVACNQRMGSSVESRWGVRREQFSQTTSRRSAFGIAGDGTRRKQKVEGGKQKRRRHRTKGFGAEDNGCGGASPCWKQPCYNWARSGTSTQVRARKPFEP